jgi:beta-lactamase class A
MTIAMMRRFLPLVPLALAALATGCAASGGSGDEGEAASQEIGIVRSLSETVNQLALDAPVLSPGTEVAIAVQNLSTREHVETSNANDRYVSASSAKAIWVAAAMLKGESVEDIARPIFQNSDNDAAGIAIDRAGGPDAVNRFMTDIVGMEGSFLARWYGRVASTQGEIVDSNYFTARSCVLFLRKISEGAILTDDKLARFSEYMTWSPDSGLGGWMSEYLPATVRTTVMHKGGWLPPGTSERGTLNEIGIVTTPKGTRYAVAILARRKSDPATATPTGPDVDYWGKHAGFVKHASCEIYRAIAGDALLKCY